MKKLFLTLTVILATCFGMQAEGWMPVGGIGPIELDGAESATTKREPSIIVGVVDSLGRNMMCMFMELEDCGDFLDVVPNSNMLLKTIDGTVYEVPIGEHILKFNSFDTVPFVGVPYKVYKTIIIFELPSEIMEAFTNTPIVKYRFALFNGDDLDYTLSEKKAAAVQKKFASQRAKMEKNYEKLKKRQAAKANKDDF